MMRLLCKKMVGWLALGCLSVLPIVSFAKLHPFTEADCPALANPKTVLLVHATWCSHCRAFKPVYEKVSNQDKYQNWVFYEVAADDLWKICGQQIDGFPYTYKNNMQTILKGNRPQAVLEHFLDN